MNTTRQGKEEDERTNEDDEEEKELTSSKRPVPHNQRESQRDLAEGSCTKGKDTQGNKGAHAAEGICK
jgi:hypothetical protein